MISTAEARLGRTMSLWVAITAILSLVVGFVLIGPDADGYSEQWGLLNGVVNFASNFAQVAMVIFAIKLFNIDDNPLLKLHYCWCKYFSHHVNISSSTCCRWMDRQLILANSNRGHRGGSYVWNLVCVSCLGVISIPK